MAGQRFYQLVLCSEAYGRAFLRHILITPVMGRYVMNEVLPPSYENVIERLRDSGELIVSLPENFPIEGDRSCPYCGNTTSFYCQCGSVSCAKPNAKIRVCPNCQGIFDKFQVCGTIVSESGLIRGGVTFDVPRRVPVVNKKQDDSLIGTFKRLQGFVDRLLPDESPPKNKALPPPKKKK